MRWGLWMSPIINSFLRPVGVATWYNQDGAIHTLWAICKQATTTPAAFQAWSLSIFVYLLAYDSVRILIWLDHMGLRVATLVNLSFLGMDRLDQRLARWLGPAATAGCIPESVKRFATWAPLLIPFYIPRGHDWDVAWTRSETLQREAASGGLIATLVTLPLAEKLLSFAAAVLLSTFIFAVVRRLRFRHASRNATAGALRNASYEVSLKANGEVLSRGLATGYDLSRRSYDLLDPAGRALFLVEGSPYGPKPGRSWAIIRRIAARPCVSRATTNSSPSSTSTRASAPAWRSRCRRTATPWNCGRSRSRTAPRGAGNSS